MKSTDIGRSRLLSHASASALTAAVGTVIGLTTPALAVGEATAYICRTGPTAAPFCPWYTGQGPALSSVLGPNVPITGRRAVIGLVSGFLPPVRFEGESLAQVDHEVFQEGVTGRSRVLVGLVAGVLQRSLQR